jgi:hypothetical protein
MAQYLMHGPTCRSLAMWRQPALYQHIAQGCERSKLDRLYEMILLAN